ncbi:MAG: hypothetical protein ACKVJG_13220 [Candidatus Latescibacterota bacterium]|jgi:hypothetical protein
MSDTAQYTNGTNGNTRGKLVSLFSISAITPAVFLAYIGGELVGDSRELILGKYRYSRTLEFVDILVQ